MTITTNLAEVIGVLQGIQARVRDTRPAMERIKEHQHSKILLEIMSDKGTPDGQQWASWADSTRIHRENKGNAGLGLLWDEGMFLASIQSSTTINSIVIGSPVKYAKWLQEGTKNKDGSVRMPARPVFGWSDEDTAYAELLLARHILP